LNAAITTIANPAIAPPIAGTKGLAPLKAIHHHHSRAIRSINKRTVLFIPAKVISWS
jgi:hypothetical protein